MLHLIAVLWMTSNLWHLWRAGQSLCRPLLHVSLSYSFFPVSWRMLCFFPVCWRMLQKSFVCSASCWGCIDSVLTGDIDLISEHLTLPTPLLLSLMLSAVTSFWPKLGSEESPTGSLPDAQCLGSLGNLIRCQRKRSELSQSCSA